MNTKLAPQAVFRLVGTLPKELQAKFRKDCWVEVKQEETEFVPDPELRYDHVLGLSWLTDMGIPNTHEELNEQREVVFKTMVSGPVEYNVGQFFVVFPDIIYSPNDVSDVVMIVEVMADLEFPGEEDLTAKWTPEFESVGYMERGAFALKAALQSYAAEGKIKIHQGGMRMYMNEDRYKFEEQYPDPDKEPITFKTAVRRHRQNISR